MVMDQQTQLRKGGGGGGDGDGEREKHGVLEGKYELGRLLGQGTFARVYHARNLHTGKSVAMKVVGKEKVVKSGMMEQMKREISVMKRVKHPNIVELYEVMASKSKIYLAMELAKGGELFTKVSKGGKLDEHVACSYFKQLISAVDFCHSRGVYHRDLKLENLLLDEHGNLKITDFGLSTFNSNHQQEDLLLRTSCGTPHYVAPEVVSRKGQGYQGSKADIWSCGVILFALMAGFLPFHDDNIIQMYRRIYKADFKCPAWFSPEACSLVTRMLDPKPATRITVSQIVQSDWYCSSSMSMACDEDVLGVGVSVNNKLQQQQVEEPETLNAFHIISLSHGLDLSPMFEVEEKRYQDVSLTTTAHPASAVISKMHQVATSNFQSFDKAAAAVPASCDSMLHDKNGPLAIAAQLISVSSTLIMVEVTKDQGEYHPFCSNQLHPTLKDIVWTCPCQTNPINTSTSASA